MRLRFQVLSAVILAASLAAHADTLTYTVQAFGSGSLGASTFNDAFITLSGTGNTADIFLYAPMIYELEIPSLTLTIAGLGSTTITDQVQVVSNSLYAPAAGFGDNTNNKFILGDYNSAFTGYDLSTPIQPLIFGDGDPASDNPGTPFNTVAGAFVLNSAETPEFTAVPAATTPEPGTFALLATGLLGALGMARKRRT